VLPREETYDVGWDNEPSRVADEDNGCRCTYHRLGRHRDERGGLAREYRDKTSPPRMDRGMPDRIRLAQYQARDQTIIEAYVQPTFVNRGLNTRVEVIRGMSLSMQPAEGGSALEFRWRNHGTLSASTTGESSARCVAEEYTGDTSSLVVAPNQALAPVVLFGPKVERTAPYFEPGSYLVTLTVERTANETSLKKTAEVVLTQEAVDLMGQCKSAILIPANPPQEA
jgi:hypothetical protein